MKLPEKAITEWEGIIGHQNTKKVIEQLQLKDLSELGAVYSTLFEAKAAFLKMGLSDEKIDKMLDILARDLIAFSFPAGASEFFKEQIKVSRIELILAKIQSVKDRVVLSSIADYLITLNVKNMLDLFFELLSNVDPTKTPIQQIKNVRYFAYSRTGTDLIDLKNLITSTEQFYEDTVSKKAEDINRYIDPNIWKEGKELGEIILSKIKRETL